MVEVLEQQQRLLVEGALDLLGSLGVVPLEVGSAEKLHHAERLVFLRFNFLASSWSEAMNSLWVAKGPWTLPWGGCARSGECGAAWSRRALGLLTIQLLGFLVERSDEFFVGSKRTVDIAGVDFGQTFCKLSIDDAALLRRVLVGRSRGLGVNADDATADLEFDLLAALKTGLPAHGRRNHKRRFVFHGDGHGR